MSFKEIVISRKDFKKYNDKKKKRLKTGRCPQCHLKIKQNEPDPCLGYLPGVKYACCGHGIREESYIRFINGLTIKGFIIENIK